MASTIYEPIMAALFALLQSKCGSTFQTYSRRFLTWEMLLQQLQSSPQVLPQPALFLFGGAGLGGGTTGYVQGGRTPSKRTLKRTIVIYAQLPGGSEPAGSDVSTPGDAVFYPLIESVEAALEPDPANSFGVVTLGGLVTHCWIEGDGVIVTGELDPTQGQGMATVPVNILLP